MAHFDNRVKHLLFWCQKVLPLVYDDSLSYYEVLCKVTRKLNEIVTFVNEIPEYIDSEIAERLSDEHIEEILRQYVLGIENAISDNNEGSNTNASKAYTKGDMLWWNDKLYRAIVDIPEGTTLLENVNVANVTFEDMFNTFIDSIKHDICAIDEGTNSNASADRKRGDMLWINNRLAIITRDILSGTQYIEKTDTSAVTGNFVYRTVCEQIENIYNSDNKRLTIHAKVDGNASILRRGDYHVYDGSRQAIKILEVE